MHGLTESRDDLFDRLARAAGDEEMLGPGPAPASGDAGACAVQALLRDYHAAIDVLRTDIAGASGQIENAHAGLYGARRALLRLPRQLDE